MVFTLAKTLALMTILCAGWLLVQRLWLRSGQENTGQLDALAGRSGCGNCGCEEGQCGRQEDEPDNREANNHAP